MSEADDRELKLIGEVESLRDFYRAQGKPETVTLFAEDYEFLKKRKKIAETEDEAWLDGYLPVRKGPRRRKPRRRRPPDSMI